MSDIENLYKIVENTKTYFDCVSGVVYRPQYDVTYLCEITSDQEITLQTYGSNRVAGLVHKITTLTIDEYNGMVKDGYLVPICMME